MPSHQVTAIEAGRDRERHRSRQGRQKHGGKPERADIQGLRAVAVVVVVLNHLTGWPKGGFVGVDVFFVISGYLITGRLLRTATTKSIGGYFGTFYKLRARRILPAGLVVIALTVLAAHLFLGGSRAHDTTVDGGWAAVFWANWHFAAESTNYFDMGNATSPLQHYWSLAVEEQFYLVWPVVVLAVCLTMRVIARRRGPVNARTRDMTVGTVALLLAAISFTYGIHDSATHPAGAYFSTLDRAWELGVGAVLACLLPHLPRLSRQTGEAMSWLGLGVITVALLVTPSSHGFPAPWAALSVAGSALVIAAGGLARGALQVGVLTNPVSTYLGDISYSVYLTHFPLVVILGSLMHHHGAYYWVAVLLGTLGLSTFSFYFIEEPFRAFDFGVHPNLGAKATLALTSVTAAWAAYGLQPVPRAPAAAQSSVIEQAAAQSTTEGASTSLQDAADPLGQLRSEIAAAVQATSWPATLSPSMGEAPKAARMTGALPNSCQEPSYPLTPEACTFGDSAGSHTAVVLGDSLTMSLASGLYDLAQASSKAVQGWKFVDLGSSGCSFAAAASQVKAYGATTTPTCQDRVSAALEYISSNHPDLVLMTEDSTKDPGAKLSIGLLSKLGTNARVAYIMAPPTTGNPADCYTKSSSPADVNAGRKLTPFRRSKVDPLGGHGSSVVLPGTRPRSRFLSR